MKVRATNEKKAIKKKFRDEVLGRAMGALRGSVAALGGSCDDGCDSACEDHDGCDFCFGDPGREVYVCKDGHVYLEV